MNSDLNPTATVSAPSATPSPVAPAAVPANSPAPVVSAPAPAAKTTIPAKPRKARGGKKPVTL